MIHAGVGIGFSLSVAEAQCTLVNLTVGWRWVHKISDRDLDVTYMII